MTSKNFVLNTRVASWVFFFLSTVEYFMYLHNKQGAHCQMPTCFSYLQVRLQYFHLPDMELLRASLPTDTQVSRWESGTLWHDGPDPVDHTQGHSFVARGV